MGRGLRAYGGYGSEREEKDIGMCLSQNEQEQAPGQESAAYGGNYDPAHLRSNSVTTHCIYSAPTEGREGGTTGKTKSLLHRDAWEGLEETSQSFADSVSPGLPIFLPAFFLVFPELNLHNTRSFSNKKL